MIKWFVCEQELELRWQEFYEVVTVLLQWIRHHILVFQERKFPSSYEEIEVAASPGFVLKTRSRMTDSRLRFLLRFSGASS